MLFYFIPYFIAVNFVINFKSIELKFTEMFKNPLNNDQNIQKFHTKKWNGSNAGMLKNQ